MTILSIVLLVCNVLFLVAGQLLWKTGVEKIGSLSTKNVVEIATSPYIWAGLILYAVATILWLKVLSDVPLSLAYPLQSTAYVLGIVAAWIIFGESIPWTRWLGSGVLLIGVYLISMK